MSNSDTPAWELSKENAAPLARGRNIKNLEKSLLKPLESKEDRIKKDRLKHHFERMIDEDTEDPLIHWLSYIKFHQDAYPSDTHATFLLMERCARTLMNNEKYKNDVRFIRVCVLYADKTSFPGDVFKFLHQHKIGSKVALFWIAWAWIAETRADYAFAEKVFTKGIQKEAAPLKMLQQRHKQFQRRMSRHWLNESQKDAGEEEMKDDVGRSTLGGLSEKRVRRNDRRQKGNRSRNQSTFNVRTSNTTNANKSSAVNDENAAHTGGAFPIFVDQNENDDAYDLNQSYVESDQRELESEAHRTKENTLKAERWNKRGGYKSRHGGASGGRSTMHRPPSFEIHVDNECAAEHKDNVQRTKSQFDKGGRALQRREREDVAEKLARDPTRYMVNPEKLQTDTKKKRDKSGHISKEKKDVKNGKGTTKKGEISCGFDKRLVAKDIDGQECCFEEQRAKGQVYTILRPETNFNNLLKKEQSYMEMDDGGSVESVNMEEIDQVTVTSKQSIESSASKARRVLFSMNVSFDRNNQIVLNASTASSTINDGVGLTLSKEEETINTKFAMKELSMMFSSPALGMTEDDIPSNIKDPHSSNNDVNETASYSVVAGLIGDDAQCGVDNSIVAYHDNQKPKSEMTPAPTFEIFCEEANNLKDEKVALRGTVRPEKIGFDIFKDEENNTSLTPKKMGALTSKPSTFNIFQELPTEEKAKAKASKGHFSAKNRMSSRTEHTIKEDVSIEHTKINDPLVHEMEEASPREKRFLIFDEGKESGTNYDEFKPEVSRSTERNIKPKAFQIFNEFSERVEKLQGQAPEEPFLMRADNKRGRDDKSECTHSSGEQGGGDTATFSLFGEAMNALNDLSQSINEDKEKSRCINEDKETVAGAENDKESDTATFSIFGEAMEALNDISQSESKHHPLRLSDVSSVGGKNTSFLNNSRRDSICDSGSTIPDEAVFGDDCSKSHSPETILSNKTRRIEYQSVHKDDIKTATRQLNREASRAEKGMPFAGPETDLSLTLSKRGNIVDLSNQPMPKGLKRKAAALGEEIQVGKRTAVVKQELGKGSYGVVVLIESSKQREIAVKAQMPTDCLAWEYVLMKRLEERIGSGNNMPFPSPLSFVTLSDGGLLSMSAGSRTGMNLVDICNVYRMKEGGPVPELIALHYTCRMLKHIETLHWRGKILHCDVKPDNWVVIASDCAYEGCNESVEASDLMLVDFGRAVDLTAAAKDETNPLNFKLNGMATSPEMACVASRLNLEWSFDVDTFGICASAHVLLYGSHIEISMDQAKRWNIRKRLRRYWQKELWAELFETLLNLDDVTRIAIGSRPKSLREIRRKFEHFLSRKTKELESLLKHQYRILPKKRLE